MSRTLDCFEYFVLTSQFPHLLFADQPEEEPVELEDLSSEYEHQRDREAQLESDKKSDWSK